MGKDRANINEGPDGLAAKSRELQRWTNIHKARLIERLEYEQRGKQFNISKNKGNVYVR